METHQKRDVEKILRKMDVTNRLQCCHRRKTIIF